MFVLVWFAILVFMPKAELYYGVEKVLAKKDIRLNEGSIDEGLFSLTLYDVALYAKGIEVAHIKEVEFFTILFYSSLRVEELTVDEALQSKVPARTQEAHFSYTLFMPTTVSMDANGSFGVVEGSVDLLAQTVKVDFVERKEMEMLKPLLKKDEKGWHYEGSF